MISSPSRNGALRNRRPARSAVANSKSKSSCPGKARRTIFNSLLVRRLAVEDPAPVGAEVRATGDSRVAQDDETAPILVMVVVDAHERARAVVRTEKTRDAVNGRDDE